jgi:acyl carrier protein
MKTFESRLLEFVRGDLLRRTDVAIDENTYLFDDGLIDSLKILQLIAFVEIETGRTIPDRDIVMSNFRTVRTIAQRFGNISLTDDPFR